MRFNINAQDRELALFALELADHECETTRKGLERLRQEHFGVMALQGRVSDLRTDLKDTKRHVYDWAFDHRAALATAFYLYREQLEKLAAKEGKLLVSSSPTDEKISDVRDFIARLAGQDTLFTEQAHEAPAAAPAVELPVALTRYVEAFAGDDAFNRSEKQLLRTIDTLAGELERGAPQLAGDGFRTVAQLVLKLVARVYPALDGTRAGAWLLQEVAYDETNALVLASWIRQQLALARQAELPLDEPPKKLTREGLNEIRQALGKEPLVEDPPPMEQEVARRVEAEHAHVNPIDVACTHCGAKKGKPCTSVSGKIVATLPHAARMKAAGAGEGPKSQVADRLYTDAVLQQVFGRVDPELRKAAIKRRSIDLTAKWVQTAKANGANGGHHASA